MYEAIQALQAADFSILLADLPGLAAALEEMEYRSHQHVIRTGLERWLDLDEPGALRALEALGARTTESPVIDQDLIGVIYNVLARRTPQWFFRQLPSLREDFYPQSAIRNLLEERARSNPREAREWLETFRARGTRSTALAAYLKGLAYSDPRGAMEMAAREFKYDIAEKKSAMQNAYLIGVTHAPSISVGLLEMFEPEERASLIWSAIERVAETRDPLGWLQEQWRSFPKLMDVSPNTYPDFYSPFVRWDPARTLEWFNTFPHQKDFLGHQLIKRWSETNPSAVMDWLTAQPMESLPSLLGCLQKCIRNDPERFQKWINDLPPGITRGEAELSKVLTLVEENRFAEALHHFPRKLTGNFFRNYNSGGMVINKTAKANLPAAVEMVTRMEPGPHQANAATGLLAHWTQAAPEEAAQWVQALPEGALRDASLRVLASGFAVIDLEDVAFWVTQIRDSTLLKEAISDMFGSWHQEEPWRAEKWLNQLPGVDESFKETLRESYR